MPVPHSNPSHIDRENQGMVSAFPVLFPHRLPCEYLKESGDILLELIYHETLTDPVQLNGVWKLLCKYDDAFFPPLSARNSTHQDILCNAAPASAEPTAYFDELKTQSFLLAVEDGEVLGFLSFLRGYLPAILKDFDDPGIYPVYISTIIVDEKMRRQGVALQLYNALLGLYPRRRIRVSTRTWSRNISHISLLEKMGFSGPAVIKDDRGPGIDTVYYHFYRNEVTG